MQKEKYYNLKIEKKLKNKTQSKHVDVNKSENNVSSDDVRSSE